MPAQRRKYGEGTVYERDGKWYAAVSNGTKPNGKRDRIIVSAETEDAVIKAMTAKLIELGKIKIDEGDNDRLPEDITVAEFIDWWLLRKEYKVSHRTLFGYIFELQQFKEMYGSQRMKDITVKKLDIYFDHCKSLKKEDGTAVYSTETLKKFFARLKTVFKKAEEKKILIENPFNDSDVTPPESMKTTVRVEAYSQDDLLRIFDFFKDDIELSVIFRFMVLTGMRPEEMLGLRWGDVDFRNSTITIVNAQSVDYTFDADFNVTSCRITYDSKLKTEASQRTLHYSKENSAVFDLLRYWKLAASGVSMTKFGAKDSVFGSARKERLSYNALRKLIERRTGNGKFDIPVCLHRFRHTAATIAAENGATATELQALLGHSQLSTTARYITKNRRIINNATDKLGNGVIGLI